ncbi:class I SAM-dependent methyltransferase [Anaerovibrio sp. RM50]|uniref:class I SAM-dependent methyltransferase n=1 Tax=Anaerovibrio sp. RM50 TaxID=1200557 RepID=UPI000487936D|nr:class I SAM-dependent methyltransferase [Anaerovibrio sp. RM50]
MKDFRFPLLALFMGICSVCFCWGAAPAMAAEPVKTIDMEENTYAVSDTAYLNLDWLAGSGNEDAAGILKLIGNRTIAVDSSLPDYKRISEVNQTFRRINYDALNLYCLANGYTEIMDLGCGYSPRGIYMCERGRHYTGCDFASVIRDMRKLTSYLNPQEKLFLHYKMAGVTNASEMEKASQELRAPVCILSEGLWMYLGNNEKKQALANIKRILDAKGGCFITTDFSLKEYGWNVAEAMYPGHGDTIMEETMELYDVVSRDDTASKSFKNAEEAEKFIRSCNLQVRRVPLIRGNYEMDPNNCLTDFQEHYLLNVVAENYLWVITSDAKRPSNS